jgi:hypothetical protein
MVIPLQYVSVQANRAAATPPAQAPRGTGFAGLGLVDPGGTPAPVMGTGHHARRHRGCLVQATTATGHVRHLVILLLEN